LEISLSFAYEIIFEIDSVFVIPYKYENPNKIIAEAIILRIKYFIAASLDRKLDLFKAINEYKLNEDSSIPRKSSIKLFAEIIIKQPRRAKINNE
jgi:hypothetical protein